VIQLQPAGSGAWKIPARSGAGGIAGMMDIAMRGFGVFAAAPTRHGVSLQWTN
jgi:hypothetical protein